jgi:hypothetical protein
VRLYSPVTGARILIPLLALVCLGVGDVRGATPPVYRLHQSEAENKIRRALEEPTPDNFDFIEQPLSSMVEFVEDYYKINVEFDNVAMEEAAVSSDTPFQRSLPNISLGSALDLILRDLDLDYLITDDVLLLTTRAAIHGMTEVRMYDVRDIPHDEHGSKTLAGTIEKTFADRNGETLTVVPFDDVLIIRDSQKGHDEIEAFLATLRLALAGGDVPTPKKLDSPKQSSFDEPAADESPSSPGDDPFSAAFGAAKPAVD